MRTIAPMAREDLRADGLPSRVALEAHGLGGYRLSMHLMEAVSLGR